MIFKRVVLNFLLNKRKKEAIDTKKLNKILLIRNSKIGDAICCIPLLRELNKNFPKTQIDIYAGHDNYFIFEKLSYCDKIFIKYRKRHSYKTLWQVILMKFRRYDLIIEAVPMKFGTELAVWFMKAKWIFALGKFIDDQKALKLSREDLSFYDALVCHNEDTHTVEFLSGFLPFLGIKDYSVKMEFPYDKERHSYAKNFLSQFDKKKGLIALNVDASKKRITLYKDDIVYLSKLLGDYFIVILSLPSRQEEIKKIILEEKLSNCTVSYKTQTIFDAAELVRSCDMLISPDTSFIHIASAINLPVIGFYYKENICSWGARSDFAYTLVLDEEQEKRNSTLDEVSSIVDSFFDKK